MKSSTSKMSWLRKSAMMTIVFAMGSFAALAQTKTVSGTIVDDFGDPVLGANVIIVGTTTGVTTDIDGNFSLSGVPENAQLKVTFIGYTTQTVSVSGKSKINVTLKEDVAQLEDVVVVGYGTMKKADLTGSVASIGGDKLKTNPVSNVAEALQGQLPGVNVTSQDGRPGASMSIRVRGGGSITQSNDPLFIVDGVAVSSIDDIPADNIESIDVLKDAASTAIYGARGANGVILVTTKKAKEGRTIVKYNMYYQKKSKPEILEMQNAYDHVVWNWGYAKALGDTYANNIAKYYGLGSAYGNHVNEYRNMSVHNYMEDVLHSTDSWNHDLSISGGTAKTKYYASLNYSNDEGTLINSGFKRINANFKLTQQINKNLKWNTNVRYGEMEFKGNRYEYATQASQYKPIDNPLGSDVASDLGMGSQYAEDAYNPVSIIDDYENLRQRFRIRATNSLTWNVIKGLTARSELTLGRNWTENQFWAGGHTAGQSKSEAKLTKSQGYDVNWNSTLTYDVQGLGKDHSLNIMVGNEIIANKSNTSVTDGYGYPVEWNMEQAFGNMDVISDKVQSNFSNAFGIPSHTTSFFGRLNYNFKGRYMLTATMRADGSSKFSEDNHWGYFPAVAGAWRISDESWMENTKDWMDNLKLRLSYGTSGNDGIAASSFTTNWESGTDTNTGNTVYKPTKALGNPDLVWETTSSRNAGIDYSVLNGKINGSFDAYWNTTDDCLMLVPCDPTSGFSYQMQNVAKTSNKGFELSVNYNIIRTKDFNLNFGLRHNINVNKVEKILEGVNVNAQTGWASTTRNNAYDYIIKEGEPVGLIQGFVADGIYTVDDFNVEGGVWKLKEGVPDCNISYAGGQFYNRPSGQNAFPGMAKFKDVDDNGIVDKNDLDIIGRVPAKHTGGFNLNGSYKGFDFTMNFAYQLGGKIQNVNVMKDMYGDKDTALGRSRLREVASCWKMFNVDQSGELYAVTDPNELAALNKGAKYALNYNEAGITSSQFVEDATFLRLQNLTIGYTIDSQLTKKIGVSNARVYFTGGNLFCLKKYSGLDPDVNVSPNADSNYSGFPTPGYDYHSYPKTRTFTFGLNVTF